jgi:sarcosine oxidase
VTRYDAVVVGLGAMGSSAVYQFARRGLRVLGLEAFGRGHRLGSSHGESRIIRLAYHEHPNYVPLLHRAYALWDELQADSGEDLLRITGGLLIGSPDSELVSGARASAELHGLSYELLTPDEVQRRYPAVVLAEGEVALWEPRAGFLRPEQCLATFTRLARQLGADLRYEEPVRAWRAERNGVEVTTDRGRYHAEQVVFTCGARISGVLGARIPPVVAERMPLFWLAPAAPEQFALGRLPVYLWETDRGEVFYGFPHLDWPGAKVARHHSGEVCDPDRVDRTVHAEDEAALRRLIERRLPALNGPVAGSLVCLYENSPDRHFLIDRLPEHPNALFAGGFSGHGFKFATVVGEILADLTTHGQATPEADFLRVRLRPQLQPRAERLSSRDHA